MDRFVCMVTVNLERVLEQSSFGYFRVASSLPDDLWIEQKMDDVFFYRVGLHRDGEMVCLDFIADSYSGYLEIV